MNVIFQDYLPGLFNLVWLSLTIFGLKIENFFNTILGKNVVIAFDTLMKPKSLEQATKRFERDIRI